MPAPSHILAQNYSAPDLLLTFTWVFCCRHKPDPSPLCPLLGCAQIRVCAALLSLPVPRDGGDTGGLGGARSLRVQCRGRAPGKMDWRHCLGGSTGRGHRMAPPCPPNSPPLCWVLLGHPKYICPGKRAKGKARNISSAPQSSPKKQQFGGWGGGGARQGIAFHLLESIY